MPVNVSYNCIFNHTENNFKTPSSSVICSSKASYENSVILYLTWWSLNLISISKPVDIGFAMLQRFSKAEFLNLLKKSNKYLIWFGALSYECFHFVRIYWQFLLFKYGHLCFCTEAGVNICVDTSRMNSGGRGSQHYPLAESLHSPAATAANLGPSVVPEAIALWVPQAAWRLPRGCLGARACTPGL